MAYKIILGDCLEVMQEMETDSVDLVFCSPPYEDARTYGIDFKLRGQDWVDWCFARYVECLRVSRGLVAWVVEGKTQQFRYSAAPTLLMADLHRAGVRLRKPVVFRRNGIPGSGGPDWLRNDWEWIVCAAGGKLPWSDNTAMGHPTKYDEGGACTNRKRNGVRVGTDERKRVGSHRSQRQAGRRYAKPRSGIANPGNIVSCTVGKGHMGDNLCHENEAPFPESLAEFFIRSFCPPDGTVLDPFCGSGTTLAVANRWGRRSIGIDVRESQTDLTRRRIKEIERTRELVK